MRQDFSGKYGKGREGTELTLGGVLVYRRAHSLKAEGRKGERKEIEFLRWKHIYICALIFLRSCRQCGW